MERATATGRVSRNAREHRDLVETDKEIFVPHLSFCISATTGRHTGTDWSRTYVAYRDRVRRLTPAEVEPLQGFPEGWTRPRGIFAADADLDSKRYHALGNAVSVPVISWLADRVAATAHVNHLYPHAATTALDSSPAETSLRSA